MDQLYSNFVIPGRDDLPHVRLPVRLDPGDGGTPEEEVSHPQGHDGQYHTLPVRKWNKTKQQLDLPLQAAA